MLQSWVSLAQENQPCSTSLPCLINQQQGVSILMVRTQQPLKIRMLPVFRREKLGFVFQDFNLLDTLSVKDNILLPLVLSRRPLNQMLTQVEAISRQLGISSLAREVPL